MAELISISSIKAVHEFLGVGAPEHPLISILQNTSGGHEALSGHKFVLNLYQITLKHFSGKSLTYGRNTYDFEEGTLIFSRPGQTLAFGESEESDANGEGWTLLFHPDLIRTSELGQHIENYSFFSYDAHEALHLSEAERKSLEDILKKIEQEYAEKIDRYSQSLINANIKLLLDYCTRYFDRQFYTRSNQNKDVVTQFEQLLKNYYQSDKPAEEGVPSVSYCGRELGLSPSYLSDLLKKETGRNALEHIHFFIIEKAKTALLASDQPVGQIAYALGFEYPQHFARVFKNKVGLSPSAYRGQA